MRKKWKNFSFLSLLDLDIPSRPWQPWEPSLCGLAGDVVGRETAPPLLSLHNMYLSLLASTSPSLFFCLSLTHPQMKVSTSCRTWHWLLLCDVIWPPLKPSSDWATSPLSSQFLLPYIAPCILPFLLSSIHSSLYPFIYPSFHFTPQVLSNPGALDRQRGNL